MVKIPEILRTFIFRDKKTLITVIVTVITITTLPFALTLVNRQQIYKSKAVEPTLLQPVNPITIGFDTLGLVYYGAGAGLLANTEQGDVELTLNEINRLGGRIVRVFAPNRFFSNTEAAQKVDKLLNLMEDKYPNIKAIISLTNYYSDLDYYCAGCDKDFARTDEFYAPLLTHQFFEENYKERYIPFVKRVVSANRNHNSIYAWEIGNELRDNTEPRDFVNFMKDTSSIIKQIDPVHDVSTGMMSAEFTRLTPEAIYPFLKDIDIISIVTYNNDPKGEPDVRWAVANGKKAIINEAGFTPDQLPHKEQRAPFYAQSIKKWSDLGASAYLIWGFVPQQIATDRGHGGGAPGMDVISHVDYDEIADVIMNVTGAPKTPIEGIPSYYCSQCIVDKAGLLLFYKNSGWSTDQSNFGRITKDWCENVNRNGCFDIKKSTCADACDSRPKASRIEISNYSDFRNVNLSGDLGSPTFGAPTGATVNWTLNTLDSSIKKIVYVRPLASQNYQTVQMGSGDVNDVAGLKIKAKALRKAVKETIFYEQEKVIAPQGLAVNLPGQENKPGEFNFPYTIEYSNGDIERSALQIAYQPENINTSAGSTDAGSCPAPNDNCVYSQDDKCYGGHTDNQRGCTWINGTCLNPTSICRYDGCGPVDCPKSNPGVVAPVSDTCPGKHQEAPPYICDPACCTSDAQCPNGQSCNIGNGGCQSGLSCNPVSNTVPNPNPGSECPVSTNRYCFACRRAAIVATKTCTGLGIVTEVIDTSCNDAALCFSPSSCRAPYPQCGGSLGLEGEPSDHTFYVTPVCDTGEIVEYRKVDLGRLEGQCGN